MKVRASDAVTERFYAPVTHAQGSVGWWLGGIWLCQPHSFLLPTTGPIRCAFHLLSPRSLCRNSPEDME